MKTQNGHLSPVEICDSKAGVYIKNNAFTSE